MGGKVHAKDENKRAPKGHFVVYLGEEVEEKRHVLSTALLKNKEFQELLEKSAEEYGFDGHRGIVLHCDEPTLYTIINALKHK